MGVEKYNKKLGIQIAKARVSVGLSQYALANKADISKKTLQNWEAGITAPSVPQLILLFEAIGKNPMPYVMEYLWDEKYNYEDADRMREELHNIIDILSVPSLQALSYILLGDHGSSPASLLQMILTHLNNSLRDRALVCSMIALAYDSSEHDPNAPAPNTEIVARAMDKCLRAVMNKESGYVNLEE